MFTWTKQSKFGARFYLQVLFCLLPRVRQLSLFLLQLGDEVVLVNQLLLQPADLRVFNYDVFLALLESAKEGRATNGKPLITAGVELRCSARPSIDPNLVPS